MSLTVYATVLSHLPVLNNMTEKPAYSDGLKSITV